MHVIKEKCFNRVHSFTLAGKHQMHLVRELLQRLCLHKEPEMLILGTYCSHCVAQNREILFHVLLKKQHVVQINMQESINKMLCFH